MKLRGFAVTHPAILRFSGLAVWIPALTLVSLLVWGASVRLSLPMAPISDPDTWGYLNPALSWLSGHGFQQTYGRDALYSGFVALAIGLTGSFQGIVWFQIVLGWFAGVFIAATWAVWVSMLPAGRAVRAAAFLLGGIPVFVQMVNPQTIFYERCIRPEAILGAVGFAQLLCAVTFCKFRWHVPRPFLAHFAGSLSIVLAYACLLLKPSWAFASVTTVIPVAVGLFTPGLKQSHRAIPLMAGITAAVLLLWLPAKAFVKTDSASRTFLPSTLFTIHADLIEPSLAGRVAKLPASDPKKRKMENILAALRVEMVIARADCGTYERLKFDPDYLFYSSSLMNVVRENAGGSDEEFRAFCIDAYLRAALANPAGMAEKIFGQFQYFLFPDAGTFFRRKINIVKSFRDSLTDLPEVLESKYGGPLQQRFADYRADLSKAIASSPKLGTKVIPKWMPVAAGRLAWCVEVMFLIGLAAVCLAPSAAAWRLPGRVVLLFLATPAANALTVSIIHALDLSRYCHSFGGFLLFGLCAAIAFLVSLGLTAARQVRPLMRRPDHSGGGAVGRNIPG